MSLEEEREWTLQEFQEFRFEVEPKDLLTVKVISGKAELFGTELANQVEYQFKGKKLAIFTWHGCVLKTKGKNVVEYIGFETPMQSHINLHFALEELRELSKQLDKVGPRVMLLGPADVGKTSLAKTLIGYATRSGSSPILVDLDPDQVFIHLNRGLFHYLAPYRLSLFIDQ
jgi:polyribonucleotide 5'-hydroxyl-kinase